MLRIVKISSIETASCVFSQISPTDTRLFISHERINVIPPFTLMHTAMDMSTAMAVSTKFLLRCPALFIDNSGDVTFIFRPVAYGFHPLTIVLICGRLTAC